MVYLVVIFHVFSGKMEVNGGGEKMVLPVVGMFRCTTKHITLKA